MLAAVVLPAAAAASSVMSSRSAGSTTTSTPSSSPSSRNSSVVNATLQRPASAHDHHLVHTAVVQRLQSVVGDVGVGKHIGVGHQDAGDVDGDVAVADDHRAAAGDVRRHLLEVRVRVVPADEVDCGHAAGQLLAGNAQGTVGLGAHRVDDGVVAFGEFVGLIRLADREIAEEAEPGVAGRLLEGAADRLDLRMVRAPHRIAPDPKGVGSISSMSTWTSAPPPATESSANCSSEAAAK